MSKLFKVFKAKLDILCKLNCKSNVIFYSLRFIYKSCYIIIYLNFSRIPTNETRGKHEYLKII